MWIQHRLDVESIGDDRSGVKVKCEPWSDSDGKNRADARSQEDVSAGRARRMGQYYMGPERFKAKTKLTKERSFTNPNMVKLKITHKMHCSETSENQKKRVYFCLILKNILRKEASFL